MELSLAGQLDALSTWRRGLDRQAAELARYLLDHDLQDEASERNLGALRERRLEASEVRAVVRSVAEGVSLGAERRTGEVLARKVLGRTAGSLRVRTGDCGVSID